MAASRLMKHSGMDDGTYKDIPANTTFNITGMGNVRIDGTIGKGAIINKSGMGDLKINGKVSEDVKFTINSMGNVIFSQRPLQSVIDKIQKSGMGDIRMPGGFKQTTNQDSDNDSSNTFGGTTYSGSSIGEISSVGGSSIVSGVRSLGDINIMSGGNTSIGGLTLNGVNYGSIKSSNGVISITKKGITTKYKGHTTSFLNGGLAIDGRPITDADDRLISISGTEETEIKFNNSHAAIQNILSPALLLPTAPERSVYVAPIVAQVEVKLTPEEIYLNRCSPYTKAYLESFKGKKSHSEIVKEMNLSAEELEFLKDCQDQVVSMDIMDKPVMLNESTYDFNTVLTFKDKDPQRIEFTPRDIQPCRKAVTAFEEGIKKINELRKTKALKAGSSNEVGSSGDANSSLPGAPGGACPF